MSQAGREMFQKAKFVQWLGVEILELADGICQTKLVVRDDFLQQDGFVHAGVLTTLADHSAGGAGGSLLASHERVLSIEFKTNFLRAAKSRELYCHSVCLKKGRSIAVAESEIYPTLAALKARDHRELLAKSTVTLAVLSDS